MSLANPSARRQIHLVRIPAGPFTMGSRVGHGEEDEFPEHEVFVSEFLIARYLVTAAEWAHFLNEVGNPDRTYFEPAERTTVVLAGGIYLPRPGCGRYPANGLSWFGAERYCRWLSEKTGSGYRLPSEAEWEKACRGGLDRMRYPWGNDPPSGRAQFALKWIDVNHTFCPVGSYPPNPYGLLDMVGLVWEWCADWFSPTYYPDSPPVDPRGPETGQMRVLRGGSWRSLDVQIRCGIRLGEWPASTSSGVGFRLVRQP